MAAITICSDFGAPQNKVCQCFHCLPNIKSVSVSTVSPPLCHEVMGAELITEELVLLNCGVGEDS